MFFSQAKSEPSKLIPGRRSLQIRDEFWDSTAHNSKIRNDLRMHLLLLPSWPPPPLQNSSV